MDDNHTMSKINEIQNALNELDGARFQKLCECYLHQKGYENLNSIGSVSGADKTRQGTPDILITDSDGNYIFVECTTQKENIFNKLSSDLDKCLDESKTGIDNNQINKIIFCHTGSINARQYDELVRKYSSLNILLETFPSDTIAIDLFNNFPSIAKNMLGITIDTGQIVSRSNFIKVRGGNKFSTPLSTNFYGRKFEVADVIGKLNANQLVLITGSAGVGKTRLALEVMNQFKQENSSYQEYCIKYHSVDIYDDLQSYFSKSGDFLIHVDDANRIKNFNYIAHLLNNTRDDQDIKVIATVRKYAIDKIRDAAASLVGTKETTLSAFNKHEITELVQKSMV